MIWQVECPNPAYEKIKKAGIDKKIKAKKKVLEDLTYFNWLNKPAELAFKEAELFFKKESKISQEGELFRDILDFQSESNDEEHSYDVDWMRECLLKHPAIVAYLALGKDVLKFRKLGFPTRRSLEESVAGFCIGERRLLFGLPYAQRVWRNGRFKNEISRNEHGDLSVSQTDVSGKYRKEDTFFGEEEVFETILYDPPAAGFGAYQDWSCFLLSLLRYAEALGKAKMPEILNWREIVKEEDGYGGNWVDGHSDWNLPILMDMRLFKENEGMRDAIPLRIPNYQEAVTTPYLSKDGRLVYLSECKGGEICNPQYQTKWGTFRKVVEYDEKDLLEALKANYKYFARDRLLMHKIMDSFIEETK